MFARRSVIVGKVFIVKVFAVNMFNLKALMKRLFNEKAFGCKYVQLQVYSAANTFAFGDAVLLHFSDGGRFRLRNAL